MASTTVGFTLNRPGIGRLVHNPTSLLAQRVVIPLLNDTANGARTRANVDTGLMRSTIGFQVNPGSPPGGQVFARTNYAWFVHEGARGYPGNPFLRDALRDAMGRL